MFTGFNLVIIVLIIELFIYLFICLWTKSIAHFLFSCSICLCGAKIIMQLVPTEQFKCHWFDPHCVFFFCTNKLRSIEQWHGQSSLCDKAKFYCWCGPIGSLFCLPFGCHSSIDVKVMLWNVLRWCQHFCLLWNNKGFNPQNAQTRVSALS